MCKEIVLSYKIDGKPKAGSHEQRKRKRKRKRIRRSDVERKRKQNEIRTRISVPYDGGNLVPGVRVTPEQQSGSEDSGNEIKDGGRKRCFRIANFQSSELDEEDFNTDTCGRWWK